MNEEQIKQLFLLTKQLTLTGHLVAQLQDSVLDYDKLDKLDSMSLALHDANGALRDLYGKLAT